MSHPITLSPAKTCPLFYEVLVRNSGCDKSIIRCVVAVEPGERLMIDVGVMPEDPAGKGEGHHLRDSICEAIANLRLTVGADCQETDLYVRHALGVLEGLLLEGGGA